MELLEQLEVAGEQAAHVGAEPGRRQGEPEVAGQALEIELQGLRGGVA